MTARILPLPPDAVSQIRSSKHITTLQGVAFALLENSLDAGAVKIELCLDFPRGSCSVEDDGEGVLPSEFLEEGGLGRMYHTSKRALDGHREVHGTTGTYLAQLAALSLLSITSKHTQHKEHASLTMHHGKIIARQVPAPLGQELTVSTHGTRVVLRDLFGNMPVRVKQRALIDGASADDEKAWQELKRGVVALLLAWPKPCAIKLRDSHNDSRSVNLSGFHSSVSTALTARSLNQLGSLSVNYDLRDALPVVFQAGLVPHECRQSWVPISASASSIAVKGTICLEPAPTKHCQFISIGIHPCSAASGHNELYAAVNKVFANSSFGLVEAMPEFDEAEKDRRKYDRRYKKDGYTQKQLRGRKGVDRHPSFVLQVRLKGHQDHHALAESTGEAHLKTIVDVLEATVMQWLAANHFRPRKRKARENEKQRSPSIATSSPRSTPLDSITQNKVHSPISSPYPLKRSATVSSAIVPKKREITDLSGRPLTSVERAHNSPSAYFDGLSRIKSGKQALYQEISDSRKLNTAPAGQLSSTATPTNPSKFTTVFKLPALQVGQLGSSKAEVISEEYLGAEATTSADQALADSNTAVSSDHFGSLDDDVLLAAVEPNESATGGSYVDHSCTDAAPAESVIGWTDPVTKQVYQVNTRTGVVLPMQTRRVQAPTSVNVSADSPLPRSRSAISPTTASFGKPLSLSRRTATPAQTPAQPEGQGWLPGFLKDWQNPVFAKQDEERIPVASFNGPGLGAANVSGRRCNHRVLDQHFAEAGISGTAKLSKAGLKSAKVIRQVDEKFILCKFPGKGVDLLVLVDQHAASERVILEGLFSELCMPIDPTATTAAYTSGTGSRSAVTTVFLERPQRFQISAAEAEMFAKQAQHFANWGILFDLSQTSAPLSASQVRQPAAEHKLIARTLPPGIAERCSLFPNLLIELLRSEIWSLAESAHQPRTASPDQEAQDSWLKRLGSCPKGIIDLLNSRACRSAIMFNDVLSVQQCEGLLADLSGCAFPFMCAHGRVSMVPMVELGVGDEGAGSGTFGSDTTRGLCERIQEASSFKNAFKKWQGRRRSVHEAPEA